jgi:hypothetical protein
MLGRALILGCLVLGVAVSSFAENVERNTYLVTIHFSSHAFGKNVVAVYGHAGILMSDDEYESFWQDTKHIEMEHKGDHFFGKATLMANTGRGYPDMVGPRIQYWVHFEDGSKIITQDYEIPVYATSLDDVTRENELMTDFSGRYDTWRTEAVRITHTE